MAELERFFTRRERRLRRLAGFLVLAVLAMAVIFFLSYKASIWDNNMSKPEWVSLTNNDGDHLSALVLKPTDIPPQGAPAVIVVHDLTGHKEQLNRISFELVHHGFIVMALDLRDHGVSGGQTTFGDYYDGEPNDIVAAYNYLVGRGDVDTSKVALLGDGFGGAAALMAQNILLKADMNVTATVAWAPPIDVVALRTDARYSAYWDAISIYLDRRTIGLTADEYKTFWDYNGTQENRSPSYHMDAANWTSDSVYIVYGDSDKLIPTDQYLGIDSKAEVSEIRGLGHGLRLNDEVLKQSITFIETRLTPGVQNEISFNYPTVERFNSLLSLMSFIVMALTFMMLYEVSVMKKTSRTYIPEISRNEGLGKLGIYTLFDIVVYALIAYGASKVVHTMTSGWLMDVLPGAKFFTVVLFSGALMLVVGFSFWYVEARMLKKDEERSEETCGNIRGILLSLVAFVVIITNFLAGSLLLTGPNYPKTFTYLLPTLFVLVFFLGHEIWMRKILHPKINTMLGTLFLRRKWPFQVTFFLVMYGIYAALMLMMFSAMARVYLGPDFMKVYLILISAIGFVSTLIYHRSKSILASVTYSTIMAPWLLNLMYHF